MLMYEQRGNVRQLLIEQTVEQTSRQHYTTDYCTLVQYLLLYVVMG